jgi:hypothetical protein
MSDQPRTRLLERLADKERADSATLRPELLTSIEVAARSAGEQVARQSSYLQQIIEQEEERRKMLADMAAAAGQPSCAMDPLPASVTSVTSQLPVIEAMTEQSTDAIELVIAVQAIKDQQVQAATEAKRRNRRNLAVMFAALAVTVALVLFAVL